MPGRSVYDWARHSRGVRRRSVIDLMATDRDFTPREIEVFASVMLHGTTTKAADALNITQPAVSKTLVQLTNKAGFQLFKKSRQRLIPTPEAHMLYAEVQRVFESARG